jgi:hypothetical protein
LLACTPHASGFGGAVLAVGAGVAVGVEVAECTAGLAGAAALPHAAAARPMPVIRAVVLIRFRLAVIAFLMSFFFLAALRETATRTRITVIPQDTHYDGHGGQSVHFPCLSRSTGIR